ncbi:MAG: hypothetical protein ACYTF1_20230 [Planctomycetota bacterium]|jgi:hypothetical protein
MINIYNIKDKPPEYISIITITLLLVGTIITPPATGQFFSSNNNPKTGKLDKPYVDGSFGFSITPPAGCEAYREKQILGTSDVEIIRFVSLEHNWSLAVRLSSVTQTPDTQMIINNITAKLDSKYKDVKVINAKQSQIAGRQGVRYAASFVMAEKSWLRQQAVIRYKPNEYYALVMITPLNDRKVANDVFDKIVEKFTILRTQAKQEQIRQALERGTKLLQSVISGQNNINQKSAEDNYLKCIMDGKEIGFIQINEQIKTLGHRKGLAIHKWAWLFKKDKSITHMKHNMFVTNNLSFEQWENRLLVLTPPRKNLQRTTVLNLEQGIRNRKNLLIAYTPIPNAPQLREKAIEVEISFASAPWDILMPRIVDLNQPNIYAFSVYDSSRRGLSLKTIRVSGPNNVSIDGRKIPAFKLEDSEGLIPPIHDINVDQNGRLLKISTDQLQMVTTTKQYVEKKYGRQVTEAVELFKKYPAKEPSPPQRNKQE